MTSHVPDALAARLLLARGEGPPVPPTDWLIPDHATAHAVQDATLRVLGPVGGWKVGAASPTAEPGAAPLPARGLLPGGSTLHGPAWRLRGIELEVAVRLGRDVQAGDLDDPAALPGCIEAVVPAIEVCETRLADWAGAGPLERLADLQGHGALVLGAAQPWPAGGIDLRSLRAQLFFDGQPVADAVGAHPVGDLLPLLAWLARHAQARGTPLRAGQVVTTGSCTGLLFAGQGMWVEGEIVGLGRVGLRF